MNWYIRLITAQFGAGYGKYWIDEYGDLMYADGDIGNMNHEAYVIQRAQGMIAPDDFTGGEYVEWDEFLNSVGTTILETAKSNARYGKLIQRQTGEPLATLTPQDMISYGFVDTELTSVQGVNPELLEIAKGHGDARLFGMKTWGWKRVMNNNVETYTLTDKDLAVIAKGLGEIAQEDDEGESTWNIESVNPRKFHQGIPLKYLDMGLQGIQSWESAEGNESSLVQPAIPSQSDSSALNYWDRDLNNWKNRTSD